MVGQLVCLSMPTACITTMPDRICLDLCKLRSSLATWLAFAMVSSSCLVVWVSVLLYSLSVTFTGQSSVSRACRWVRSSRGIFRYFVVFIDKVLWFL